MAQPKWFDSGRDVQIGDIVLFLKKEGLLNKRYQYGKITEVERGRDGLIREVKVMYRNHDDNTNRTTNRTVRDLVVIHAVDELNIIEELGKVASHTDSTFHIHHCWFSSRLAGQCNPTGFYLSISFQKINDNNTTMTTMTMVQQQQHWQWDQQPPLKKTHHTCEENTTGKLVSEHIVAVVDDCVNFQWTFYILWTFPLIFRTFLWTFSAHFLAFFGPFHWFLLTSSRCFWHIFQDDSYIFIGYWTIISTRLLLEN